MTAQLPYIPLSGLPEQLAVLDRTARAGRICTVFGPMGSGKTALLRHWVQLHPRERIVHVTLDPATGEYRSVSHMIYARVLEALLERRRPSYAAALNPERTPGLFGRRQMERLRSEVQQALRAADPQALIIDSAEYLDFDGIVRAMKLRQRAGDDHALATPRGLILAGQPFFIKDKEQPVTWLNRLSESREAWTERLTLAYPIWAEIAGSASAPGMAPQFLAALQLTLADGAAFGPVSAQLGALIEGTKRNIASLRRLMVLLDDEAERRAGQRQRVITQATLAQVQQRLGGLSADAQEGA